MPITRPGSAAPAANAPSSLREINQDNLEHHRPFQHPSYPHPYDDFPRCCYEGVAGLFGHLPKSQHSDLVRASLDTDPYSITNIALAQASIDQYRQQVSYPAWSERLVEYPVPDWINKLARKHWGCTYAQVEIGVGWRIEWFFDLVLPLLEVRAITLSCLKTETDPVDVLQEVLKASRKRPIEDIHTYLLGIAKRNREQWPSEPRGEQPITTIVRPSLAEVLPGWDLTTPSYDEAFAVETTAYHHHNAVTEPEWYGVLSETEVGTPTTRPSEWLGAVRSTIDPARAKLKANKLSKWSK